MALSLRGLVVAATSFSLLLAACGKSEPPPPPPPPPKAEAAPPSPNAEVSRLASEVYVFAFPLVLMDVTRQVAAGKGALNAFTPMKTLPDASTAGVVSPNADMLYSSAWLDLSKGPVVLSVPDTRGRYYVIAMHDAWSNVFTTVGKRTIGTDKQEFTIVGPNWKGGVAKDAAEIKSPTDLVYLVGRIDANGKADVVGATKILDQWKLKSLAASTPASKSAKPAPPPPSVDLNVPPAEQVAAMDAGTYFTRMALLLPGNPPAKEDAAMAAKIATLGISPGTPFEMNKLDPATATAIAEGVKTAQEAIVKSSKANLGDLKNGWTTQWDLGRFGTNYGLRAVMALLNLGAPAPEDAIFASTHLDAGGQPLTGAKSYVLHFDKGATPPTDAFWALSMYTDARTFAANPIDRYAIGSRDKPQFNPDGSLDIYISRESPGAAKQSNWLPAPAGNFNVIMRVYSPKSEALGHKWTPPGIKPVA